MMRSHLASERLQRTDPQTGVNVVQLTSYPTPSACLPYDWPTITPDNRRVVIKCQRSADRRAPWDLFRVDTDGLNLYQLTERDECAHPPVFDKLNAPTAMLSIDGRTLYVLWNGDPVLYSVDVETGKTDSMCSLAELCSGRVLYQHMRISTATNRLFIALRQPRIATLRVDLDTGDVAEIDLDGLLWACLATEPRLVVATNSTIARQDLPDYVSFVRSSGERVHVTVDEDGGDSRFFCGNPFSHATMLGGTARIQGCGMPPDRCIWIAEENAEPRKLTSGPYFWHSGPSFSGEWIVADTAWPDMGLQLIHVPTGHFGKLCDAGAAQAHVASGHPHPGMGHDGSLAVFNSDRAGIAQAYVAHVTAEFRESVAAGELSCSDGMRR